MTFKYKWHLADELLMTPMKEGKYLVFRIPLSMIEPAGERWLVCHSGKRFVFKSTKFKDSRAL